MNNKYILDENGNPKVEQDLLKWGKWFETAEIHVGNDTIGGVQISTVFLGLDHSFGGKKPLIYETMIFGGKHDQYQERYYTKEEALEGHKKAVELVKNSIKE
jgi:hypothetical protein